MQHERHERLGAHAAQVISLAKAHQVSVDELMWSLRELVEHGTTEHDGAAAAVAALEALPQLEGVHWWPRPTRGPEGPTEAWQTANAERMAARRTEREAALAKKHEALELRRAEARARAEAASAASGAQDSGEPDDQPKTAARRKPSRKKSKAK